MHVLPSAVLRLAADLLGRNPATIMTTTMRMNAVSSISHHPAAKRAKTRVVRASPLVLAGPRHSDQLMLVAGNKRTAAAASVSVRNQTLAVRASKSGGCGSKTGGGDIEMVLIFLFFPLSVLFCCLSFSFSLSFAFFLTSLNS